MSAMKQTQRVLLMYDTHPTDLERIVLLKRPVLTPHTNLMLDPHKTESDFSLWGNRSIYTLLVQLSLLFH